MATCKVSMCVHFHAAIPDPTISHVCVQYMEYRCVRVCRGQGHARTHIKTRGDWHGAEGSG